MPNWIRATGRAFVRAGLAASPMAYAAACSNPGVTPDATYCGTPRAPHKSRRQRRAEREARENEREAREYSCGDWPQALEGWPHRVD